MNDVNDENDTVHFNRMKKIGRKTPSLRHMKSGAVSKVLQDQMLSKESSAKFSSPPNALIKGNTDIVCRDIVTTPINRRETRSPLSQLTQSNLSSKRLSRLRSIYSQSPGATLLTQKPVRTPLRKLEGRNCTRNGNTPSKVPQRYGKSSIVAADVSDPVISSLRTPLRKLRVGDSARNGITPSKVPQSACGILLIADIDEHDSVISTPLLDRRVHFLSDEVHPRTISNNLQGRNSLHTPRQSALKHVRRYSPSHPGGTPNIQRQLIVSPLNVSEKSVTILKRTPFKKIPRSAQKTLLSCGPSRVRVQEGKRTPITKSNLRKSNNTELEDTLQTPSKRLLNSSVSSRVSSHGKNAKSVTSTFERINNRKMIASVSTPQMKKYPISISTTLEEDFDEEETNVKCLWRDTDIIDAPVQERAIDKISSIATVGFENEIMALDLVDVTEINSEIDESYDSIASQFRVIDNDVDITLMPDTHQARNFDPVAFTLMNNGIEDGEALRMHDRAPCANNSYEQNMHIFGERSSALVPEFSSNLSDVMDDEKVALLARPVASYPQE